MHSYACPQKPAAFMMKRFLHIVYSQFDLQNYHRSRPTQLQKCDIAPVSQWLAVCLLVLRRDSNLDSTIGSPRILYKSFVHRRVGILDQLTLCNKPWTVLGFLLARLRRRHGDLTTANSRMPDILRRYYIRLVMRREYTLLLVLLQQ